MQKLFYLIVVTLGLSTSGYCQVITAASDDLSEKIYTKVDVEATFKGGDQGWRDYLTNNLQANTGVVNGAPSGKYTVIIKFVVSNTGRVGKTVSETNLGYGMGNEAIRLILATTGKWNPARVGGNRVASYRRQPITFMVP